MTDFGYAKKIDVDTTFTHPMDYVKMGYVTPKEIVSTEPVYNSKTEVHVFSQMLQKIPSFTQSANLVAGLQLLTTKCQTDDENVRVSMAEVHTELKSLYNKYFDAIQQCSDRFPKDMYNVMQLAEESRKVWDKAFSNNSTSLSSKPGAFISKTMFLNNINQEFDITLEVQGDTPFSVGSVSFESFNETIQVKQLFSTAFVQTTLNGSVQQIKVQGSVLRSANDTKVFNVTVHGTITLNCVPVTFGSSMQAGAQPKPPKGIFDDEFANALIMEKVHSLDNDGLLYLQSFTSDDSPLHQHLVLLYNSRRAESTHVLVNNPEIAFLAPHAKLPPIDTSMTWKKKASYVARPLSYNVFKKAQGYDYASTPFKAYFSAANYFVLYNKYAGWGLPQHSETKTSMVQKAYSFLQQQSDSEKFNLQPTFDAVQAACVKLYLSTSLLIGNDERTAKNMRAHINQAIFNDNYDELQLFMPVIRMINSYLGYDKEKQHTEPSIVYRGTQLRKSVLAKFIKNEECRFATYLSTSYNIHVAMSYANTPFAANEEEEDDALVHVIFKIHVPAHHTAPHYRSLKHLVSMHEEEVLFVPYSKFKVVAAAVPFEETNFLQIELAATDNLNNDAPKVASPKPLSSPTNEKKNQVNLRYL